MRVLVQPFGRECHEFQHWTARSDPDCSAMSDTLSNCAEHEIFDWVERKCVTLCPLPLQWTDGECMPSTKPDSIVEVQHMSQAILLGTTTKLNPNFTTTQRWVAQNETTSNCTELTHRQLREIAANFSDYESEQLTSGLRVTEEGSSDAFCVECAWYVYNRDTVSLNDSVVTISSGQTYTKPFYLAVASSVVVCRESTDPQELTLLGKICSHVEGTATVVLMCISIICLIIMVVVYSILPTLHNVPGYIVLSKVGI